MTRNISDYINLLEKNPNKLKYIFRGLERETLRICEKDCTISKNSHPKEFGSALTNRLITTDFSESSLELITPVNNNITNMLSTLYDLHRYVMRYINCDEYLWPFSMPCFIKNEEHISVAQYGKSNIGQMKTIYREGLKRRYSAMMQIISGVHYNFSLSSNFFRYISNITNNKTDKTVISDSYLHIIRNYFRFGWIIPYLFGASPGICSSFLQGKKKIDFPFEKIDKLDFLYLPYATSLRLSDLGYTQNIKKLNLTFNSLEEYVICIRNAMNISLEKYKKIGIMNNGRYIQLNTNILQHENELYTPIRPKRNIHNQYESLSESLLNNGIEYLEIRSLDINPFSPIGIEKYQILFLDIFLVWCALVSSPLMNANDLLLTINNWNRIILEGRKPGITLFISFNNYINQEQPLSCIGHTLFNSFRRVATVLDIFTKSNNYKKVCDMLEEYIDNPNLTISANILKQMTYYGINNLGLELAKKYKKKLINESYEILSYDYFNQEKIISLNKAKKLEESDSENFKEFIKKI